LWEALDAIISVPAEKLFEVPYNSVECSPVFRCSYVLPSLAELSFLFQALSDEGRAAVGVEWGWRDYKEKNLLSHWP
jgi:hypothetical protein